MLSGSPTMSPAVMRGLSEANGSWKMICICAPVRAQLGLAEAGDVLPLNRIAPLVGSTSRSTAARRRRFAAAGFADQAERLAGAIEKLTPSTACTCRRVRRSMPPSTGSALRGR